MHLPSGGTSPRAAIVLCPPFGWQELWIYRTYMYWADALAGAGYAALRIDLPGTGESGGSALDPGRFEAWSGAVAASAGYVREATGCERVVALGAGLGGTLAFHALAAGAPIDDLVLWSVPARGRSVLVEMGAIAQVVETASRRAEPLDETPPEGSRALAGFLLAADAASALDALDLTALEIPTAKARRALLLTGDTLEPDRRLVEHLERQGVAVTAGGTGTSHSLVRELAYPQPAVREVYDTTISWLAAAAPAANVDEPAQPTVGVSDHAELEIDGSRIREAQFEFGPAGARIRGVLAEPLDYDPGDATLSVVLLNAGPVRRIGLARMWVETSRRWAARGVPVLRLDVLGIGESDGDSRPFSRAGGFYRDEIVRSVTDALDALEGHGLPGRFLLIGHCSGGYWAFHAALTDERVCATVLFNPAAFFWKEVSPARQEVDLGGYASRTATLLRRGQLPELARRAFSRKRIQRVGFAILRRARRVAFGPVDPGAGRLERAFQSLHDRGVPTLLLVGHREYIEHELPAEGSQPWPGVTLERIPGHDHMFASLALQARVHEWIDRAVEEALDAAEQHASRDVSHR
jgi:pimeloyl-ACP methyl ester carboxylesterase